MQKPKDVLIFEWLMYFSLIVGLPGPIIAFNGVSLSGPKLFLVLLGVAILFITFYLVWLAANRRLNWARWTVLILFVLKIPSALKAIAGFFVLWGTYGQNIPANFSSVGLLMALGIVQLAMQGVAIGCVFSNQAKPWFLPNTFIRGPKAQEKTTNSSLFSETQL